MPKFDPRKFLSTKIETSSKRAVPEGAQTNSNEIEELFDDAFTRQHKSCDVLDSLYEWWETEGFLTKRQYVALRKFAGKE